MPTDSEVDQLAETLLIWEEWLRDQLDLMVPLGYMVPDL